MGEQLGRGVATDASLGGVGADGAGAAAGSRSSAGSGARTIRRQRALPGGRAVVGALLVAAAAVGVTGAYLSATASPSSSYVVAATDVAPGTRLTSAEEVRAAFGRTAVDLPGSLAARAIPVEQLDTLVGTVVVAPLARGDLVVRTVVVDAAGATGGHVLSVALPRTAAVAGALRPGERIDLVATYGAGNDATTDYVVRDVPLLAVDALDGAGGSSRDMVLTLELASDADVLAVGHAISGADVFVARAAPSPRTAGGGREAPGAGSDRDGEPGDDG